MIIFPLILQTVIAHKLSIGKEGSKHKHAAQLGLCEDNLDLLDTSLMGLDSQSLGNLA